MFNGARLREIREQNQMKLAELAQAAGISIPYLSSVETGRVKNPNYAVAEKIAGVLGIPVEDLLLPDEGKKRYANRPEREFAVDLNRARAIRTEQQLSMNEVARRSGLNPSTISILENGKRKGVSFDTLSKLAKVYGCDIEDLLLSREFYVDLNALILQTETVIIGGEEIDVRDRAVAERLIELLEIGKAWVKEANERKQKEQES